MKKYFKAVISALLAFVLFASSIPAGTINAFAAGKLSIDIDYDYYGAAFVTLTPSNPDNYVTYTTDGSVPKADSEKYKEELAFYEKTTLRVAEYTPDGDRVKGLKTTVKVKTAPVTFKVTQLGGKAQVTMSCATEGAEIRYTTDGSKPSQKAQLYTEAVVLTEKTKIRARAYCDGYKTTTTYAKTVKITPAEDLEDEKEEEKTETKSSETETEKTETVKEKVVDDQEISYKITYMDSGKTYVTLTPAKSGYTIRYTTDGSTPSKKSAKYKSRIGFEEPTVLRARQYNGAGECVGTIKLNVKIKCAEVEFSCVSMDTGIREIKMTCATPGATIYYTTNGTSPKGESGRIYTEPVFASDLADVMAYAVKDGYKDSSVKWEIAGNVKMKITDFDFSDNQYWLGIETLNNYRLANGLSTLAIDEDLSKAATMRAIELSINYSHTRPSGRNYTTVFGDYGIDSEFSAEYIDRHHENARQFIDEVLQDKTNANRILTEAYDYTRVGIGYYETNGTIYWVLIMITEL